MYQVILDNKLVMLEDSLLHFTNGVCFWVKKGQKRVWILVKQFWSSEVNQYHLYVVQGLNLDHFAHSITEICRFSKRCLWGPQGVGPGRTLFMNFLLESWNFDIWHGTFHIVTFAHFIHKMNHGPFFEKITFVSLILHHRVCPSKGSNDSGKAVNVILSSIH